MFVFKQKYTCCVSEKLQERGDHLGRLIFLIPFWEVETAKFDPKKQILLVSTEHHSLVHLLVNFFFFLKCSCNSYCKIIFLWLVLDSQLFFLLGVITEFCYLTDK